MEPLTASALFLVAAFAGLVGSMLGLGGGIIIVPALTQLFNIDFGIAVATSLFCVVATSIAGTAAYLRRRYTDLRLGLLLVLPAVIGASLGGNIAQYLPDDILRLLFAGLLGYTAFAMWRDLRKAAGGRTAVDAAPATGLQVHGAFCDEATGERVEYRAHRFPWGMSASLGAGVVSGLLGVGGGVIQVPVMRLKMSVPLKVATATSNFMIGLTATTSVMVYFGRGVLNVPVTAVCALGILLGATLGPRVAARMKTRVLQYFFLVFLLATAVQMMARAVSAIMGGAA